MLKKLLVLMAVAALAAMAGACGPPEEASSAQGDKPAGAEAGTAAKAETSAKKPTPVEMVQVAYKNTAAEQTAKTSFDMTMTGIPMGSAAPEGAGAQDTTMMRMTGEGAIDLQSGDASTTMKMGAMGSFETRQVGDVVYTKMPPEVLAQMPEMKPWMKMDLDAMYEQQYGAGFDQMQGGAASDPSRQLEYLRGVSESVEKVGTETVRGASTTRYRAAIDLKKAAAEQGAGAQKATDELVKQLGTSKIPVEVWLDDQDRVRRYAMDMSVPFPEEAASQGVPEGTEIQTSIAMEFYDFGTPVSVQAPPPNQTTDASKMMPAGQTPAA